MIWDGESLPAAGTQCEFRPKNCFPFVRCEIAYASEKYIVLLPDFGGEDLYFPGNVILRPLQCNSDKNVDIDNQDHFFQPHKTKEDSSDFEDNGYSEANYD